MVRMINFLLYYIFNEEVKFENFKLVCYYFLCREKHPRKTDFAGIKFHQKPRKQEQPTPPKIYLFLFFKMLFVE